jgi:ElaB/YqjD/DUF883 family membrane-anchored ribosome-binding protein
MPAYSSRIDRADIERLLHDFEQRLARLTRIATRASSEAPRTADRISETIASALGDLSDRVRGRTRTAGGEISQLADDALRLGNNALRKLTREVERKPLLTLAIAVGVGALAVGLLARR